ncbi:hypothetical protein GW17_00005964 [Ensete ventricosum]|nr:hypothetical protein GW17_00005964 [Ensete ventricosum]RZR86589.1 hypothetical protein BHM03_00013815 [Ensete ventricosum]
MSPRYRSSNRRREGQNDNGSGESERAFDLKQTHLGSEFFAPVTLPHFESDRNPSKKGIGHLRTAIGPREKQRRGWRGVTGRAGPTPS